MQFNICFNVNFTDTKLQTFCWSEMTPDLTKATLPSRSSDSDADSKSVHVP